MTFYDILGVPRNASQEEIRAAYRTLARRYHPDGLNGSAESERADAEEAIKAINAAFHTLGDPRRRTAYHAVMWTRHDPARQYRIPRPLHDAYKPENNGRRKNGRTKTRPSNQAANLYYLELLKLKQTRQNLLARQTVRTRRLWMSAGFTSLIVYFMVAFGTQIYPSPGDLLQLLVYFAGVELITISIILNASGMQFNRFPFLGSPVSFAITVMLGALVTCGSLPRMDQGLSVPTSLFHGTMISAALLVHLYLATRLGNVQEQRFSAELRALDEQIQSLEEKFRSSFDRR